MEKPKTQAKKCNLRNLIPGSRARRRAKECSEMDFSRLGWKAGFEERRMLLVHIISLLHM
jgi:hypothetical protein